MPLPICIHLMSMWPFTWWMLPGIPHFFSLPNHARSGNQDVYSISFLPNVLTHIYPWLQRYGRPRGKACNMISHDTMTQKSWNMNYYYYGKEVVDSFSGLLYLQFLITYGIQKWKQKAWGILSCDLRCDCHMSIYFLKSQVMYETNLAFCARY